MIADDRAVCVIQNVTNTKHSESRVKRLGFLDQSGCRINRPGYDSRGCRSPDCETLSARANRGIMHAVMPELA
jgi:hypothetical protein